MIRLRAWLLACFTLIGSSAFGQGVRDWTARGQELLGSPGVVVVADSLEDQLAGPGGERTLGLVRRTGLLEADGRLFASWNRLSDSLTIEPTEAFNRLFGDRVVLAFSGLGFPLPQDWVIATVVGRGDVSKILKGLGAVQREVISSSPIFSIERGAYRLSVLRLVDDDQRALVIGPGGGNRLFADAVRSLSTRDGKAWLTSDWPVRAEGGVLIEIQGAHGPTLSYASVTRDGWAGESVAPLVLPAATPLWAARDATRLVEGSSLGMVGSLSATELAGSPIAPLLGLNQASVATVMGEAPRRVFLRIDTEDDRKSGVVMACETAADRIENIDAFMRMLVAVVTGEPDSSPNFAGRFPGALRSVKLGGGFSEQLGPLVFGGAPRLGWRAAEAGPGSGVFAVGIGSGSDVGESISTALGVFDGLEPGVLVSAGRIEPGPIGGLVERAAGLDRPVLGWTSGIDSISWRTQRLDESRVKAKFKIVLGGDD